jgi:hypothetical protein
MLGGGSGSAYAEGSGGHAAADPVDAAFVQAITDLHITTVATLDPCEVYRGQVFHDGHLWVGHSAGRVEDYRLDVYDGDGSTLLASAPVPHTLEFLYPFGPWTILAVGKHHTRRHGWLTYHSVARLRRGRLSLTSRSMPAHLQVEQFGGSPGAMYFNETGSRRVFRWTGFRGLPFAHDIRMPGTIVALPGCLFVLERNRIVPGAENVARIDLATGQIERTFTTPRRGLSTLVRLAGWPWIAAVEGWADQVLLVDTRSNTLAAVLPAPGTPVDAAQVGRHLLVVSRDPKRLRFFDLAAAGVPQVAEWDLAGLGYDFANITTMHADQRTGRVFLRSPFHPAVAGNTPAVKMVACRPPHAGPHAVR